MSSHVQGPTPAEKVAMKRHWPARAAHSMPPDAKLADRRSCAAAIPAFEATRSGLRPHRSTTAAATPITLTLTAPMAIVASCSDASSSTPAASRTSGV